MCPLKCLLVLVLSFNISTINATINQSKFLLSDLQSIVCTTNHGCFKGKQVDNEYLEDSYTAWYGIPFASPPVGPLRFMIPTDPLPMDDLWDSTYPRSECKQVNPWTKTITGSEDCLYLNIYKPRMEIPRILPVLIFLLGDSFTTESAFGPEYLLKDQRMIIITVQYRLGIFGFLSSGDDHCTGNFGLKDQNKALEWVKRNVLHFGGDPNGITLMGEGTGSISAQLQIISESSNDFFQRTVLISGSVRSPYALERNPGRKFKTFVEIAGFNASMDTKTLMIGLRDLTGDELMEAAHLMKEGSHPVIPLFRPVIEKDSAEAFIKKDPVITWSSGAYQHRPTWFILNGYEEGIFADVYENDTRLQEKLKDYPGELAELLEISSDNIEPINEYYFGNNYPNEENIHNVSKVLRDWLYYTPAFEDMMDASRTNETVNFLLFNFTSSFSMTTDTHNFSYPERGPSHSDVLLYLFNSPVFNGSFQRGIPEYQATHLLVDLLTKFVERDNDSYPGCSFSSFILEGFCKYMEVQRNYDIAMIRENDYWDMHSVDVWRRVMGIA